MKSILKIKRLGAGDVAHWLREVTAFEEDPGFGSHHQHSGLQPFLTPVLGDSIS